MLLYGIMVSGRIARVCLQEEQMILVISIVYVTVH